MRRTAHILRTAAASTAVAAALTLAGTAPAMAATTTGTGSGTGSDSTTSTTSTTGTGTTPGSALPGHLSVSGSARPGSTVTFSGTCRIVSGTEGYPTVGSVSSSAFSAVAMDKTDPEAFDGTATIAANATPGAHSVVAHCSNGDVTASVDVTGGGHVTPGGGGTGHHGSSGTSTGDTTTSGTTTSDTTVVDDPINAFVAGLTDDATLPWVLGGLALTTVAGIGAYTLGRGRAADQQREADRRARETWEAREAWEGQRRHGQDGPMSRR